MHARNRNESRNNLKTFRVILRFPVLPKKNSNELKKKINFMHEKENKENKRVASMWTDLNKFFYPYEPAIFIFN